MLSSFELYSRWVPLTNMYINYCYYSFTFKIPLGRDGRGKNQPIQNQIRRGIQGTLSCQKQLLSSYTSKPTVISKRQPSTDTIV